MFNVTKALKKLNELQSRPLSHYAEPYNIVREILLAGQEDEADGDYTRLAKMDDVAMQRIIKLEDQFREVKEMVEERLARLERNARCCDNGLFGEEHDCQKKEPSKPTEDDIKPDFRHQKPLPSKAEGKTPDYLMGIEGKTPDYLIGGKLEKPVTEEKYKHQEFKNEPFVGRLDNKPEKTVTDALSIGHLSDIGAFKQKGAKLKPVTEQDCQDDHDQPHKLFKTDKPSECERVDDIIAEILVKSGAFSVGELIRCYKQYKKEFEGESEYIRISRKVAEEWKVYAEKHDEIAHGHDADGRLYEAIKQQLG